MGEKRNGSELAGDLSTHFKRWLAALEVTAFNDLCDLQQFKSCLPERITAYCISLRKVAAVAGTGSLGDEY